MDFFRAAHEWGGQKGPLPKIYHTNPAEMKLGTVIPVLKRSYICVEVIIYLYWSDHIFVLKRSYICVEAIICLCWSDHIIVLKRSYICIEAIIYLCWSDHIFVLKRSYIVLKRSYNCYYIIYTSVLLTLFMMDFFRAAHGWGGQKDPFPKIYHTNPAEMKLDTVIPYLKKIQKIYESRDTTLEFCWNQHFFTGNRQILLH